MTDLVWPRDVLVPRNVSLPRLVNPAVLGPPAISGFRQAVASDAGSWAFRYEGIPVPNRAKILKWTEIALLTEGPVNPILVPVYVGDRVSWPVDEFGRTLDPASTRNPDLDGTAFADAPIPAKSAIIATVNVSAALRATTIQINVSQGGALVAGQFFSIGERLYAIRSIVSQVGTVWTITIRPPLREAISAGAPVEFMRPICKCRIVTDMEAALEFNRWGFLGVAFVEDVS